MRNVRWIYGCMLVSALLVLGGGGQLHAQTSIMRDFNIEASNGKAYLRWTITKGNTCNGIVISRSTDGIGYSRVGEIVGVCGSGDSDQQFLFTDVSPVANKTNYYLLEFGYQGEKAVERVFVLSGDGFVLYPNPASSQAVFHFSNTSRAAATVHLYDLQGRVLHSSSTIGNELAVNVARYANGIYIYNVLLEGRSYQGKLCVYR